jgi:hypothetical protein
MTEKEQRVRRCELAVRSQESKVREAQCNLQHGYARLQADLEREYAKLKFELERETIRLEQEKSLLELALSELARGYDA